MIINRFFFINTYDNISGTILSNLLNAHNDISCSINFPDPFLPIANENKNNEEYRNEDKTKDKLALEENDKTLYLDHVIKHHPETTKAIHGNLQSYTAFELQHKSLSEKTEHPYRSVQVLLDPRSRINFMMHSWQKTGFSNGYAFNFIQSLLTSENYPKVNTPLFTLYNFKYFYETIVSYITSNNLCDTKNPTNMLFVYALAKLIAQDTADIPIPSKKFRFEELLDKAAVFHEFLKYISSNNLKHDKEFNEQLEARLNTQRSIAASLNSTKWEDWQEKVFNQFINQKLNTIYYPHISQPLSYFYKINGYDCKDSTNERPYSKLLSIHLNSNRPAQLTTYFDNIEETADNPADIEVLVNIDIGNEVMALVLEREMSLRKFTIKYIKSPRPKSFCGLWEPINRLLNITDPNAYFLINISDEMLFETRGWDTILKKYVGLFPDHIFRLRCSRNKLRNYFDRWECSFTQDSIPFTTKRWVDIGGNWNPCFGPDSFQQLVSFYLAKEGMFNNVHYLRDVPLFDIKFGGDIPFAGIDTSKKWHHNNDHLKNMLICQSYSMQLEAKRRAVLLKANIIANADQLTNFRIYTVPHKKQIHIASKGHRTIVLSYSVSRLKINLENQFRKLNFFNYFGGGAYGKNVILNFLQYLSARHKPVNVLYNLSCVARYSFRKHALHASISNKLKKRANLKKENAHLKSLYYASQLKTEYKIPPSFIKSLLSNEPTQP